MTSPQPLPRRTSRGHLFRGLAWGTLLLLSVVTFFILRRTTAVSKQPPVSLPVTVNGSELPAVRATIEQNVCLLAAAGPAGKQTLGAGLIVSSDGAVLTCLHVMERTTEAIARFPNGTQAEVLGYRAVWPQFDLAVVQLQTAENQRWPTATFAAEVPRGRPRIVAVGHPQGKEFDARDGRFTQILSTTQMIPEVRAFAAHLTPGQTDVHWLQHTATLQAGHSGGPVLNEQGQVLGINVWVDETRNASYAVANQDVQPLLVALPAEITKLETHARPDVRRQAERWQISATQLTQVFDQGRAMQWQPTSEADYDVLQRLAIGLTLAYDSKLLAATGKSEKHIEAFSKAGDKIVAQLRKERWRAAGQLLFLNEHAAVALSQPGGFWGCVQIEKNMKADQTGTRLLATLSGFEKQLVLELGPILQPPQVGEAWIVVGVVQGTSDPPRGSDQPVVTSYVLFPLEKS